MAGDRAASARGVIAAASQRPSWPGTTSNSTAAPTAIVRVPSAIAVQWNG